MECEGDLSESEEEKRVLVVVINIPNEVKSAQ